MINYYFYEYFLVSKLAENALVNFRTSTIATTSFDSFFQPIYGNAQ